MNLPIRRTNPANCRNGCWLDSNWGDQPDLHRHKRHQFALHVVRFCESLPKHETSKTLGRQLLRSGISVGANYRAVCRAKSTADFISKFGTVLEEADESAYWMELLIDAGKAASESTAALLR